MTEKIKESCKIDKKTIGRQWPLVGIALNHDFLVDAGFDHVVGHVTNHKLGHGH